MMNTRRTAADRWLGLSGFGSRPPRDLDEADDVEDDERVAAAIARAAADYAAFHRGYPDAAPGGAAVVRRPARRVPILPRRQFTISVQPGGGSTVLPIGAPIATRSWTAAMLVVRYHASASFLAGSTVWVEAESVSTSADDPSIVFEGGISGSVPITSSTAAPCLLSSAFVPGLAARVRLRVTAPPVPGAAATTDVSLSVELIGRF